MIKWQIPDLEKTLQIFIDEYLKELLVHSRKIIQNNKTEKTLDEFLYEKHPISRPSGDIGEH